MVSKNSDFSDRRSQIYISNKSGTHFCHTSRSGQTEFEAMNILFHSLISTQHYYEQNVIWYVFIALYRSFT